MTRPRGPRAASFRRTVVVATVIGLWCALVLGQLASTQPRVAPLAAPIPARSSIPPGTSTDLSPRAGRPVLPAWWPRRLTLYTDSVGLGAVRALREVMPGWRVGVLGRPALMLDDAARELAASGDRVRRVVVVALGYNSVWERHREDFDYWSAVFDRNARRLVRVLKAAGSRKIVWVTLRDAPRAAIPHDALDQHDRIAWYFPWVNGRLRKLDRRYGDVVLADWSDVGDRRGITYDAIHLDVDGALLYARMVKRTILRVPSVLGRPAA